MGARGAEGGSRCAGLAQQVMDATFMKAAAACGSSAVPAAGESIASEWASAVSESLGPGTRRRRRGIGDGRREPGGNGQRRLVVGWGAACRLLQGHFGLVRPQTGSSAAKLGQAHDSAFSRSMATLRLGRRHAAAVGALHDRRVILGCRVSGA